MKVGIVVPYSWSYWGGVVDHAEEQANALEDLGAEVRLIIGLDPPGTFSRLLHPRTGRSETPPPRVLAVGRSVITPANGSLANIVLSPSAILRVKRTLANEDFDLLHIHEPLTPIIGVAALAYARVPLVATFHAAGSSRWRGIAASAWGFLLDRIDTRIAVSDAAARATQAYAPGPCRVIPNGVRIPAAADVAGRSNVVVFVGRHEPRKGLAVLLRAWPRVHRETGATLRVIGADPPMVRLLAARQRLDTSGVELVGQIPSATLDHELERAKLLVAPSLGGESFGMVLVRAFAAGTPAIASDIEGYRDVLEPGTGELVAPGDHDALATAIIGLLTDEARRVALATGARAAAEAHYAWPQIASDLLEVYTSLLAAGAAPVASTRSERMGRRAEQDAATIAADGRSGRSP